MNTTALRVCDTSSYSRKSPEYRLGVAQLSQWHEECRRKRIGMTHEAMKKLREKMRWQRRKEKGSK